MALPDHALDDRSFQDLVDEAKKKIPLYCPEWTDHNVSDPGITLIELFAWMVDLLIFRVNQVPRKHYIKLLDLLGIRLEAPRAAQAPVTFYLSAPQPAPVVIPQGTAVATSRASGAEPVILTTDHALQILPAKLDHLLMRQRAADGGMHYATIPLTGIRRETAIFSPQNPEPGEALYFGFDDALNDHLIGLDLTCVRAGGLNIVPEAPPLLWQVWTPSGWQTAALEQDGTGGLSWSGQVKLHVETMALRDIGGVEAHWIRCQVVEPGADQLPYVTSPIIRSASAVSWGATVSATHASEVRNEPLGRSDGSPGQVFFLQQTPLLPRGAEEHVDVWREGMAAWEAWTEVADFGQSRPEDRHYTCDSATGEIRFGPALRQPDGVVRRYGALPPRGAELRMTRYRYGGGAAGNVQAGTITELRQALAYVDHVRNRVAAQGGRDQETLEHAMFRARNQMRTRYRAVTAADYEFLTLDAFPEIARARCLQTLASDGEQAAPGRVFLVVVPALPEAESGGYIPLGRLALDPALHDRLKMFLDQRRLLTTQLDVRAAGYRRVRVEAEVVAVPGVDEQRLARDIQAALERFINPLQGGREGTGWPFGRELYLSDLYAWIQPVDGLLNVREIRMAWVDEQDRAHGAERRIDLMAHETLVSDQHRVKVVGES